MTIQETKTLLRKIADKGHQFLLKVIGSSKQDGKFDQIEKEFKGDTDGNTMMLECEQSTREDEKIYSSTNNSNIETHSSQIFNLRGCGQPSSIQTKKRYYRIVYYNRQLQQECIDTKDNFALHQHRNTKRLRQVQGCEGLPNPNKKFIDNEKRITIKENQNQIDHQLFCQGRLFKNRKIICADSRTITTVMQDYNSTEMKHIYEQEMRDEEEDIFPAKLIIRQRQAVVKSKNKRECILDKDVPEPGQYVLNHQREDFLNMTFQEINHVSRFIIKNEFGCIQFLEPVSLYRKDIEASILIGNKELYIYDSQWKEKMFKLTFYNFDQYTSKTVINKMKAKQSIFKYADFINSKIINFNETSGDLTLLQNEKIQEEVQQSL